MLFAKKIPNINKDKDNFLLNHPLSEWGRKNFVILPYVLKNVS